MGKAGREIKSEREQSARDREIYRLAVIECRPRKEIGTLYDLSEGWIVQIIKNVDEQLRKEFPEYIARLKDQQTKQLQFIYEEAMQAWEKSKGDSFEWSETDGTHPSTTTTRKKQVGAAAYLDAAMKALGDIRKIWGVDAAKKLDLNGSLSLVPAGSGGAATREEMLEKLRSRIQEIQVDEKTTLITSEGTTNERNGNSG